MQGDRDSVPDRAVGPDLVGVSTPSIRFFAGFGQAHEPVKVQAFRAELRIECPDDAVVVRLARPGEARRDGVGIGPEIKTPGDDLTAVVDPDRLRIAEPCQAEGCQQQQL